MTTPSEPCECQNWERVDWKFDGTDSLHHPNCEHYTAPLLDRRHAKFGELVWKYITAIGNDFLEREVSEDILPLAEKAGLAVRVSYDPKIHGEGIDAEEGDTILFWGDTDIQKYST